LNDPSILMHIISIKHVEIVLRLEDTYYGQIESFCVEHLIQRR